MAKAARAARVPRQDVAPKEAGPPTEEDFATLAFYVSWLREGAERQEGYRNDWWRACAARDRESADSLERILLFARGGGKVKRSGPEPIAEPPPPDGCTELAQRLRDVATLLEGQERANLQRLLAQGEQLRAELRSLRDEVAKF